MKDYLENNLRKLFEPLYFRLVLIPRISRNQERRLESARERGNVRIAFIMSSLPMWRAQGLYDLLNQDPRFILIQAIFPFSSFSEKQKGAAVDQLVEYCSSREIPWINLAMEKEPGKTLKREFDPDIVFYPQPYNFLFSNDLDSPFFSDRAVCYIPYAMPTSREDWSYRSYLNNIAWRLYYQSNSQKEEARKVLFNGGKNIRVVGEPMTDAFSSPTVRDPWKPQEWSKKRVIWAPHFSIADGEHLHRDSFTWLSETMFEIARQYQDRIQFAFKPHPRLKSVLYELSDWGKDRTDAYYESWENGSNTQLETGNYIDLFKTSDAMVHDCSSFSVEYHFTEKPVLFLSSDLGDVLDKLNDFGRDAIRAHYQGETAKDITHFLETVVLNGIDPMQIIRKQFREKYLSLPFGESVAKNIYHDLIVSLDLS